MEHTNTITTLDKEPIPQTMEIGTAIGHRMMADDPDNPLNWPLHRKIYVSAVAWAFGSVVAFGITGYTAGITGVMAEFDVSMTTAVSGMSLVLFGIAFAPIITPHLSEAFGRVPVYMVSLPIFSLFILGAGLSQSFASLAICRFFAGFFGGWCLVLIEGTFADVWAEHATVTYYSILGLSSYFGAACGPIICGFVFAAKGWRWTQWVTLMLALAAYLLGIGAPETYPRAVMRARAKRLGQTPNIKPAQSGATIPEMFQVTVVEPVKMFFTDPIVTIATIYLGFNFAVVFQWFISVPVVLHLVYNFSVQQAGLAFIAAIVGALLAALMSIMIDRIVSPKQYRKTNNGQVRFEYRLWPAMIGGFLVMTSLFWIGWTASPKVSWQSPVIGTMLFVWGNLSIIIGTVSYLFDAYPARGTLSALTSAACFRLLMAGFLPLVIIKMIMNLTGAWTYSLFGFLAVVAIPMPFILYFLGPKFRASSRHSRDNMARRDTDATV